MTLLQLLEVDAPRPRRDEDGAVVLEWWISHQCPDSRDSAAIVRSLEASYPDRMRVRVRSFPLVHQLWAAAGAQMQEEANAQGRGTRFAVEVLEQGADISGMDALLDCAAAAGLAPATMSAALADGRHAADVKAGYDEARALGIVGTPSFCVDGLLVGAGKTLVGCEQVLAERIAAALGMP
ncbi:MAG: DsbA family protein [Candidatus Nanopelagicales bacterium]